VLESLSFGYVSEVFGRRRTILLALALAMLGIPAWALAAFEIVTIILLATVVALGSERKGKSFVGGAC